jgi:hypothetical protein
MPRRRGAHGVPPPRARRSSPAREHAIGSTGLRVTRGRSRSLNALFKDFDAADRNEDGILAYHEIEVYIRATRR